MKQIIFLILSILFLIVTACSSDETEPVDFAYDYVPLTQGSWYEYELDSTIYRDFDNSVNTYQYDLRVEIGNSFINNGQEITRILRYIKPRGSTNDYQLQSVWFASIVNNRLETTEDNLDFIRFIFPPFEGTTWFGNERIEGEGTDDPTNSTTYLEGWEYQIMSTDQPLTILGQSFENVTHINQIDEVGVGGAVQHRVANEWYSRGVGLIKKQIELVVENCGDPNCNDKTLPVLDRENLRKGYILNLALKDYQIL